MSMKYLGETLDIHTGAVDNVFPHHENEIAQSEGATGKPFVKYWLHAEHLIVDGEKMAKSKGNFFTLPALVEKGYTPRAIRYLFQSVPYRMKLNFTFDALKGAASALERLDSLDLRLSEREKAEEKISLKVNAASGKRLRRAGVGCARRGVRLIGRRPEYCRRPRGVVLVRQGDERGSRGRASLGCRRHRRPWPPARRSRETSSAS